MPLLLICIGADVVIAPLPPLAAALVEGTAATEDTDIDDVACCSATVAADVVAVLVVADLASLSSAAAVLSERLNLSCDELFASLLDAAMPSD